MPPFEQPDDHGFSQLTIDGGEDSWDPSLNSMPLHFMFPFDSERVIFLSVDGRGNHKQTDPYSRLPTFPPGRAMADGFFGLGPLMFVNCSGGNYYCKSKPVPNGPYRSIEELIEATCAVLNRPCPSFSFSIRHDDPQPGGSSLEAISSTCLQAQTVTIGSSPIMAQLRLDWGTEFYIRVDLGGSFHTYPDVGGPFESIQQAENAIDRYLHDSRHHSMCMEQAGVSQREMAIRRCLYWPDGTRKKRTKSHVHKKGLDLVRNLVQAVLDQYNEDSNLFGDLAYELKYVEHHESFREKKKNWYRHLNFTARTKEADGSDYWIDKQFFAELRTIEQEGIHEEWLVSCFCMVGPSDDGCCRGCLNDMKHPSKSDAYTGGHVRTDVLFGLPAQWSDSDEDESSKERRIRSMYEDYEPFVVPAYATLKVEAIGN